MMLLSAWVLVAISVSTYDNTPLRVETPVPNMFATEAACLKMGEQVFNTAKTALAQEHWRAGKGVPVYSCEQQQFYVPVNQQGSK